LTVPTVADKLGKIAITPPFTPIPANEAVNADKGSSGLFP